MLDTRGTHNDLLGHALSHVVDGLALDVRLAEVGAEASRLFAYQLQTRFVEHSSPWQPFNGRFQMRR